MTPAQTAVLLATVGLAWLAQSLACGWLFLRVRALTDPRAPQPADPTDPADPIRALEARLTRLEVRVAQGASEPGVGPAPEAKRLHRLDQRQVASADGPVLITVPSLASTPSATSTAAAVAEFDRRFGPLWALADQGAPLDEIARATGYPVGQVELILGLRGAKPGSPPAGASGAPDRGGTHA